MSRIKIPASLIFVLCFVSERVAYSSEDRLIFVHALFRHGIRSPIHLMPADKSNPMESWQQGLGELQSEAMEQMYRLGKALRDRYVSRYKFLFDGYKTDEIYFRSTDVNRTLMSAALVAAGLYDNKKEVEEGWPMEWLPIPVHSFVDAVLAEDSVPCPRVTELDAELENSQFTRALYEQNREFFHFLTKASGFANLSPVNVSRVLDNLRCQLVCRSHYWPDWVNRTIYSKVEWLTRTYTTRQFSNSERLRLVTGMLLKQIADRMRAQPLTFQKNETRLKFFAYSAHDGNLVSFLSALGFVKNDFSLPDFGSCAVLELWQNAQGGRYVKLFYRENSTSESRFTELFIPNCGQPCRLDIFDSLIRRFVPDDWEAECGSKLGHNQEEILKFLIASFSLAIFILVAIIILLLTLLYQRRNMKYGNYRPVDKTVLNRLLDENSSESEFSSLDLADVHK